MSRSIRPWTWKEFPNLKLQQTVRTEMSRKNAEIRGLEAQQHAPTSSGFLEGGRSQGTRRLTFHLLLSRTSQMRNDIIPDAYQGAPCLVVVYFKVLLTISKGLLPVHATVVEKRALNNLDNCPGDPALEVGASVSISSEFHSLANSW